MNQEVRALADAASRARARAYAPHSGYRVGAAARTDAGVFTGCNIENASYGLSVCAERVAIFSAVAGGARQVQAIAVATQDGGTPCGACRQVLAEFAQGDCPVVLVDGAGAVVRETTLGALLPEAFRL